MGYHNVGMAILTLTTDYGWQDHYVAAVKGAILAIGFDLNLIDVTHDLAPGDISGAAFVLWQALKHYPPGSVHLAVVDPGVGNARRGLVGRYGGQTVVAPDNGLISWVHCELPCESAYAIENATYFRSDVSATFHGRDIFGPVAAHVARGVPLNAFGPPLRDPVLLPLARRAVRDTTNVIRGRVIHVDRFGNLVTNVHRDQVAAAPGDIANVCTVRIGTADVGPLRATFSDVPAGAPVAYVGSAEFLEIAVNQGSAAARFGRDAAVLINGG